MGYGIRSFILVSTIVVAFASGRLFGAEIPAGTRILLRMEHSISSRTAKEGDSVYLRTAVPVASNGRIIVPVGSQVLGVVRHAQRSGRFHGRAELTIALESLTLPDGATATLSAHVISIGLGDGGRVVGTTGVVEQRPDRVDDAVRLATRAPGAVWGGLGIGVAAGVLGGSARAARIGGGVGIAVSLIGVIAARGKDIELRPETTVDVMVESSVPI